MHATALALALESSFRDRDLTAAFDTIVQAYYHEYTDATEMDGETMLAVRHLFDMLLMGGTDDGRDFDEVIAKPHS
jgi:hypothetical protein